ncbi:RNA polymerase sigma factor [Acidiferrimicrobium sp. IK]|uniref:RNA polymerase sigma factor n=1 Tax=Acidiferrimicrobium sp. IK TaxID=2871700 RepID=UPI0021CB1D66|nr:RNA polymerase sigma factor [Acidiferrimicrobium sp. IK]MCU4186287.1 RNA polymerase sigma factor [Acidiferrimicrobium sp. IK]
MRGDSGEMNPLPASTSWEDVLAGARRGDDDCFAVLWRWLQPALIGWLRVIAPGVEEEAAAETWISVTQSLERFEGDAGTFRSWVFTIARRRAVDAHRVRTRLPEPTDMNHHETPAPIDDPSIEVTESLASEEAVRLLRRLPATQGQVVSLRVVAGLSVAETARALGKSEGAVRVLCHRGLQHLAGLLDTDSVDADAEVAS